MGVNNRERRRAKRQKRERAARARSGWAAERPGPVGDRRWHETDEAEEPVVRRAVLAAAEAFGLGPSRSFTEHVAGLEALAARGRRPLVEGAVSWCVDLGLGRAWASGWQPADVVRVLRRQLGATHAQALAASIVASGARVAEGRDDERWAAQLDALGAEVSPRPASPVWPDLAVAIEAIAVLLRLPPLPRLSAGPHRSPRRGAASSAMLERVRALLAKAESTTFPEEAEALTAKAQELMARHAINQAMLDDENRNGRADVVAWRVGVDDPYAGAKSLLLARIASAGGCRAVWCKELGFSTVFGARIAVETAEILFTSLLVQATEAMMRAGRAVDRSGRSRTRSFRQSFLVAYAQRIGERLSKATADAVADGTEQHGEALLPVLARRAEAVDDAVRSVYPHLARGGSHVNHYEGWLAGRAAAEVASLSAGGELATGCP